MGISNAIVVGGGIGGLAVATCLARRGVAVTLLEQTPSFQEVGAGLQISPNGVAVLRALGLEAELRRKGAVQGQAVVLKDMGDDREVARLNLAQGRSDQPYYFMHRKDLVDILAGAAKRENVTFEMGKKVEVFQPGNLAEVTLSDGTKRRSEVIVAADGIHSSARVLLNEQDDAVFSGQVAWRATVANTMDHPPQAHVAMGTGQHLVSYPIRDGQLVNLVAVQERPDWAAEGWSHFDDPANLRAAFADAGPGTQAMLSHVSEASLWGLHLHPVAKNWSAMGLALLGDAAHPTLPFLAQGANMALEDAWVLADSIAGQGAAQLDVYQTRRDARVRRVIAAAEKNAARYHLAPGITRSVAHAGLRSVSKIAPGRMLGAFDWLYGLDVTKNG